MKNSRALMMLVVAMVAGLAAVVFASHWLVQTSTSSVTPVAVATTDLNLGEPLGPNQIHMVSWPAGSVPTGAFTDTKALEGRVVRTSLSRGEPVIESKLAPVGTKGGLSAVIADGSRAITVRVNDVVGVAGFALPGNYVDVIVNTQEQQGKTDGQSISKIVLDHILVLAVAQQVSRDDTAPKVVNAVTLEVTPDQAERLDLARSVGTLSLVLRNQVDQKTLTTDGATKLTLLGKGPLPDLPPLPGPAPARVRPVRMHVASQARHDCVGVLTGVKGSVECF
ncbi:Flp pilus assembly protein CpaB [Burkholderia stabilis]|uniref:Flp pilus assembly protein CpaB,Flp pilus assembly protein CpaB,SAF domain n=1 Tax=Burkholderia stabilis TaxID=95485 RepID=A0AAJ5T8H1_9BURK|nr:Flp pilus assembly protein CpaB [Burkholderia stabilis]AOR72470.1 Flp pilus assembly protein CpaB [Burkholderia stabilis]VBB16609.1 Flp pilus assembly protein CpaB,Flp pilus assembly protein CpaB,SAF domain [Burkholderia stabilis]HDR9489626.1 Flp pilus assembly protein CpaB [Burkholderia stabilis]HDR9536443.1 Flp pilus assembly protein CpaB [Burkholderia stabilis]HDR9551956.1 Flp pilus assembly protein CpaB [Burkholderia stabilis]